MGTDMVMLSFLVQCGAVVWSGIVNNRPFRDNAGWVHRVMAAIVVVFDVGDVDGRGDARVLVQIADLSREVRIIGNTTEVAFKVPDINRIKPQQRREQTPVRLGQVIPHQIPAFRQAVF